MLKKNNRAGVSPRGGGSTSGSPAGQWQSGEFKSSSSMANETSPRKPEVMRGWLQKRGESKGWNKRWIVLDGTKMAYYKEANEMDVLDVLNLVRATQINIAPEFYPKKCEKSAFSIDIREGSEIVSYYFAAASGAVAEKEAWINSIAEWRKYELAKLKAKKNEIYSLQQELREAQQTIEALKSQLANMKRQTMIPREEPEKASGDAELRAELDLVKEELHSQRSRNANLKEQLEEERFMSADVRKQFLEQKRQLALVLDSDDEDDSAKSNRGPPSRPLPNLGK